MSVLRFRSFPAEASINNKVRNPTRKTLWLGGIIALQLAIPAVAFFQESPTRLGWQMYSGVGELPKVVVETVEGVDKEIVFTDIAAALRPELDWERALPEFVCQQNANAASVELVYAAETISYGCG